MQEAHAQRGAGEFLQEVDDLAAIDEQFPEKLLDPRCSRGRIIADTELAAEKMLRRPRAEGARDEVEHAVGQADLASGIPVDVRAIERWVLHQALPGRREDPGIGFAQRIGPLLDQNPQALLDRIVGRGPQTVAVEVQLAFGQQQIAAIAADSADDAVGDDQSGCAVLALPGFTRAWLRAWLRLLALGCPA